MASKSPGARNLRTREALIGTSSGVFWAESVSNILSGLACFATLWVTVMPGLKSQSAAKEAPQ